MIKLLSRFRKINNAILLLLFVNIIVFYLTMFFLKSSLENNLIKYTIDFYIAVSKNISSRIRKYIEYERYEAMKIVLQQEYYNQDLVYISIFNSRDTNLVHESRYPYLVDFIPKDVSSFEGREIKYHMQKVNINISNNERMTRILVLYVPIKRTIISDIQDEIYIGYMVVAFDLTKLDSQLKNISFYSNLVVFLLVLFSIIVSFFMIVQFYKPIEYLRNLSIEFSKYKFSFVKKNFWFIEFNYLVDSFFRMAQAIEQQMTMLESIASLDALTKLYNRGAFEKFYNAIALESKMKMALGITKKFAVIMIDVDNFKKINDTYGHNIGDKVLSFVASCIKNRKRPTDIAARYGGEEFIIILDVSSKADAINFCLDLKKKISSFEVEINENNKIKVTASFGIAFYPEDSQDKDSLVKIADENLYNSKKKGKNRVSLIINNEVVDIESYDQYINLEKKSKL